MKAWKELSWIQKINLILSLVTLCFFTFSVYYIDQQGLDLQRELKNLQEDLLELQRITTNYTSTIVVNADSAFLNHTLYSRINSTLWKTIHKGYLNVDLQIITPHLGNFTIRIKEFNVKDSDYVSMQDQTEAFLFYGDYEGTVGSGLNHISVELYLEARAYINAEEITKDNFIIELGTLRLEIELYDLQVKRVAATKEFEVSITVTVDRLEW